MDDPRMLSEILDRPTRLSGEQRAAVTSSSRYVRVVAGAGTGKTETLTRRIVYLVLHEGVAPSRVVAFTFTERAALAMKSRVYDRIMRLAGPGGCGALGEACICTIHSFCLRLLAERGGLAEHRVLDENQEFAFLLRNGWSLGLGNGKRYDRSCQVFLRSVNVVHDELLDRRELARRAPGFAWRLSRYDEMLEAHRFLTLGGLTARAHSLVTLQPESIAHVEHLLVDEYQDINRCQESLIRLIGRDAAVFAVGDPRQSIYQWRGSDEACFEEFTRGFEGALTCPLSENRRSTRSVVAASNTFADTFDAKRYKHLVPTRSGAGHAFLAEFETPEIEAEWVARQVERLAGRGICRVGDCAVLLRSVSTSARPFIDALRARGIDCVVGGKVGLFQRDETQAVGRLLAWLADEGFWAVDPWSPSERIVGDALLPSAIGEWRRGTGLEAAENELLSWREAVRAGEFRGLAEVYHALLETLGFNRLDLSQSDKAASAANLGAVSAVLADFETPVRLGGTRPRWDSLVKNLCWYLNTYATGAYEEMPSEKYGALDAVAVMTVHQAKGLEWPVVFVPAMTSSRFPSRNTGRRQDWHVPREMFDAERYEGDVEDERRLFYVALTRSREMLVVSRFRRINGPRGESAFLRDVAPALTRLEAGADLPAVEIGSRHPDEVRTFKASEILTYLRCPHLYRMKEVWEYRPGLASQLGYGTSLHLCLRRASELVKEGLAVPEAIETAVGECFHLPFARPAELEAARAKAGEVLLRFAREHEEEMGQIEDVEARLEFPVKRATIVGRVDVILGGNGSREVRDYKTTDEVATLDNVSFQVRLYASGLALAGRPVDRATVAYLNDARLEEIALSDGRLADAVARAERCVEGILEGRFEPAPGEHCAKCDYSKLCRGARPGDGNADRPCPTRAEHSSSPLPPVSGAVWPGRTRVVLRSRGGRTGRRRSP
ncbi:MAG: ATP-dependent helicase [Actinobacteria bacterium]|nr:ATP-dependent helicase [Actinomycetota bacterium]MBU2688510.1 ATP-dependent helicase [Actinomycetota bacterium]